MASSLSPGFYATGAQSGGTEELEEFSAFMVLRGAPLKLGFTGQEPKAKGCFSAVFTLLVTLFHMLKRQQLAVSS